ncbi:unnamed protein product [Brachionus calyciflorus]|uniref:Uncharacterized protein n=1 Tax=Brachionus calyciflorus TaxID=104777 RepID=A0A813XJZ1_9BILA|nr:unnamed protein product [Brachionus calyciflorus]
MKHCHLAFDIHGGVCIYTANNVFECCDEPFRNRELEQILLKIGNETILLGCIYRPPRAQFNKALNESLSHARKLYDEKKITGTGVASMRIDHSICTDREKIADNFNTFFASIFNPEKDSGSSNPELESRTFKSFEIDSNVAYSPERISKILSSLKLDKSTGSDDMNPYFPE